MSGIPAGAGSLLGKRLGKYEILALLALGGTAEIYLARIGGTAGFEKYVVVKCLHEHLADDQTFVKMFLDEARLAAHLDHSNIVQTMELGEHDGRYYMVMEFLAGLSLAMIVRRAAERLPGGRIPVPLALNMVAQACAGLHYAHERSINGKLLNIVHRDISPQNLVVSFEGVVKVVDFGIAKAELRETKTQSGTIKGKFAYMSPEQCVAANVDRRTDVFAIGVIAHELLTGRRLFKRNSPYETYQAVIECAVPPPSKLNVELEPGLDEVIMRAVAKDKDARYPTAEAFGDALLGYLHHRGKGSGPGDVSRFFEASFAQELDEYGARMRELISGREPRAETAGGWDADEEERRSNETIDLGAKLAEAPGRLDTSDLIGSAAPARSLTDVIDEFGGSESDELPADKTRIETNASELLAQLEATAMHSPGARQAAARPLSSQPLAARAADGALPGSAAAAQPAPPKLPPSGPLPLPAPPSGPAPSGAAGPRAAGFPNFSHLETMVADPESTGSDDAPAQPAAERKTQPQPHAQALSQPPPSASLPSGYPVMNAQMSQQMLSGNVYPSEPARSEHGRHAPDAPAQHPANLMSPVGPQYPQQVDWAAAAAMPARTLPAWMLAILFVAAIGVALAITIGIAKLVR